MFHDHGASEPLLRPRESMGIDVLIQAPHRSAPHQDFAAPNAAQSVSKTVGASSEAAANMNVPKAVKLIGTVGSEWYTFLRKLYHGLSRMVTLDGRPERKA
jgi:hypothetical protein